MFTLSAQGRKGAFVSFPLSGGVRGRGSVLTRAVGSVAVGAKIPPVVGMLVATGLKTGIVAVGAKEKMGPGKAMLNLGSGAPSTAVAGGERWSGDPRGGVRGT